MSSVNNTIFLSPEEDKRVRERLKGRLVQCHELTGQPRQPRDAISLMQQVTGASLLADMDGIAQHGLESPKARRETMTAFSVGDPYPPCTASLQDLRPMGLVDLRMNTHHRGRFLVVQRKAPVVQLQASSWTVVQGKSNGEVERMEILLHKSRHGRDILESGSVFMIKEPYFTLNELLEPTIRIDHPSDLVVCPEGSSIEDIDGSGLGMMYKRCQRKSAKEWKDEGNAALKRQDLPLAYTSYSHGIQLFAQDETSKDETSKDELRNDLFRNRARVNLVLNRFDEALSDALASFTGIRDQKHKELDSKAAFRAGLAAYNLEDFQAAKSYFEEQKRLMPDHEDAVIHIRNGEARLKEQQTGVYNFKKLSARVSMGQPRLDVSSFTNNVKLGESPGRGRGLFATCDLAPGQMIMVEKAFCVVWGHAEDALTAMAYDGRDDGIHVVPAGLCKAVVAKLLNNPSQIERVLDLHGEYGGSGKQLLVRDGSPIVDTFQVYDIVARNAFGPGPVGSSHRGGGGEADDENASAGLWITAAYANHSCIPNAKKESIGDLMIFRATRRIRAGEEITHAYDASSDYDTRTAALRSTWGFACTCALCVAEEADGSELRRKRQQLEDKANALVKSNSAIRARLLVVVKAKRLLRSINETYDEQRYKGLPLTVLEHIQKWLAEATTR